MVDVIKKILPLLYLMILGFCGFYFQNISPQLLLITASIYLLFIESISVFLEKQFASTSQRFGIILLLSFFGYFLCGNAETFVLFLCGMSLIFIQKINIGEASIGGISLITLGILFHWFSDNISIDFLMILGFCCFLISIFLHLFSDSLEHFGYKQEMGNIFRIAILVSVALSMYFPEVANILLPSIILLLGAEKILGTGKEVTKISLSFYGYITSITLFVIIFTPMIDLHLKLENKHYLFLICFSIYIAALFIYNRFIFQ